MGNLVEIHDLTVRFKDFAALKKVNGKITNRPGVVGLIGPNGAGKTTLIHAIFGQEPVEHGQILIDQTAKLAYCPDTPEFEKYLTALQQVGLAEHQNRLVGGFSRGMKQRLGIAAANILKPKLLFLDEPTSALDPFGRQAMLGLINEIAQTTTVVISSHLLNDIQQIAERLLVLNRGEMIFSGALTDFIAGTDDSVEILVKSVNAKDRVVAALQQCQIVVKEIQRHQIEFPAQDFEKGLGELSRLADDVIMINRSSQDLNHAFKRWIHARDKEKAK